MRSDPILKLVLTAMLFAIGLVLPFFTGQIPQIGRMLLPMHLPVFLCALIAGWRYALALGFVLPLVRSMLFSMPVFYPTAVSMAFELAAYGFFAGFIYEKLLEMKLNNALSLYASLIASMLIGRLVMGAANFILVGIKGNTYSFSLFLADAFANALPGIILQIVLIPPLVMLVTSLGYGVAAEKDRHA